MWAAVWLLRPGGVLVFSTCTHDPLENEANTAYALRAFPCLELVHALPPEHPMRAGIAGVCDGLPGEACEGGQGLSEQQRRMVLRFNPHAAAGGEGGGKGEQGEADTDTVGFYCCKFRKTRSVLADGASTGASE